MKDQRDVPSERVPAEGFPVGGYLKEEMDARGWTSTDVAVRMGGTVKDVAVWELTVDLLIHCSDRHDLIICQDTADALGKAFDVSPEYWINLNNAYQQWRKAKGVHAEPEGEQ